MATPADVRNITNTYFTGQQLVHEATDIGLAALLRATVARPQLDAIAATGSVLATQEDQVLEVDPGGGTVQIQLPSGLDVGFNAIIRQVGIGTVQIVAGTGTPTLQIVASAASPISISEQWGQVYIEVRATDTWYITGDLA